MNALKEVSRLIEESEQHSNTSYSSTVSGKKSNAVQHIGVDEVVEWMAVCMTFAFCIYSRDLKSGPFEIQIVN